MIREQESPRPANERYQVGTETISELLDCDTVLVRAEVTRVEGQWGYQIARAMLRRSVRDLVADGTH